MAFTRDILDRMASDGEIQIRLEKCCVFFGCGQRLLNPGWLMISLGIKKRAILVLGTISIISIFAILWEAFFLKRRKEAFFSSSVGSTAHVLIGAILNGFVGSMGVLKTCRGAMRRTENRGSM